MGGTGTSLLMISFSMYPKACRLDHTWVAHRLLPDLGLPQYCLYFEEQLVDGRLLSVLTRKDLEKHLCIQRKFHQASLLHAIELLRRVNFDKEVWHFLNHLNSLQTVFVYRFFTREEWHVRRRTVTHWFGPTFDFLNGCEV